MATKLKALSFHERHFDPSKRLKNIVVEKIPCSLPVEVQKYDEDTQRVLHYTEYRDVSSSISDKLKVSDFSLDNMIAAGVTNLDYSVLSRDPLSASDHLDSQLLDKQ